MRLAVSNIAWDIADDDAVLARLPEYDVTGVEIAPTAIFGGWDISPTAAQNYRKKLGGLTVPALQAILYGRPELQLFDRAAWGEWRAHFTMLADLAAILGARVLVFGSPKNRRREERPIAMAVEIFSQLAEICAARNCVIGIEPNPAEYGCDFAATAREAAALVTAVGHTNFQLHWDTGAAYLNNESLTTLAKDSPPLKLAHCHFSAPYLAPLSTAPLDYAAVLRELQTLRYDDWVSVEMKKPATGEMLWQTLEKIAGAFRERQ